MTGHDLKVERVKANVKAQDLAGAMNVHASTITRIEQRWIVDPDVIARYRAALATCSTHSTSSDTPSAA